MGCIQNKVKATAFGEISYTGHGINATNNINHVWHKILEEKEVQLTNEWRHSFLLFLNPQVKEEQWDSKTNQKCIDNTYN